jgi:hypothetical protein
MDLWRGREPVLMGLKTSVPENLPNSNSSIELDLSFRN